MTPCLRMHLLYATNCWVADELEAPVPVFSGPEEPQALSVSASATAAIAGHRRRHGRRWLSYRCRRGAGTGGTPPF